MSEEVQMVEVQMGSLDALADNIKTIADAVDSATDIFVPRAIVALIHLSCGNRVSKKDIKTVLAAIATLDSEMLTDHAFSERVKL